MKLDNLYIHCFKPVLFLIIVITATIVVVLQRTSLQRIYENFTASSDYFGLNQRNCPLNEPEIRKVIHPFNAIAIDACGDILNRVHLFGIGLDRVRNEELKLISETANYEINATKIKSLFEWSDDFQQSLSNYSQVKTIVLLWVKTTDDDRNWSSLEDTSNILIKKYYEFTASEPICTWIETPGIIHLSFDVINNWTCNRNTTIATQPKSVSLVALNAKVPPARILYNARLKMFPAEYFTKLPDFVFYMYLLKNGIITNDGDVFSDNLKLITNSCNPSSTLSQPSNIDKMVHYKEVFILTQSNFNQVYHGMIEVMSRIGPYVEFLKRNPTIKIHINKKIATLSKVLPMLGFDMNRMVSGKCRADIVYLPRGTPCFLPHFTETQLLSRHYRNYIAKNLKRGPRNAIVMIRRTSERRFSNYTVIENVVESAAVAYNLTFSLFTDNPLPSIDETALMFNSALMVVGPHGAGLANIIFSEPGTFVVEVTCNRPNVRVLFQRLALVLGQKYHVIPATDGCTASNTGVINVEPSTVNETIRDYLNQWIQDKAVQ